MAQTGPAGDLCWGTDKHPTESPPVRDHASLDLLSVSREPTEEEHSERINEKMRDVPENKRRVSAHVSHVPGGSPGPLSHGSNRFVFVLNLVLWGISA